VNQNRRAVRPLEILTSHFQSHPVIGDTPESGELAGAIDAFFGNRTARSRRALARLFRLYASNHERLQRELGRPRANPALLVELEEASRKLAQLGEAGLLALDLLKRHERGEPVDTQSLAAKIAEASSTRWRVGANQMAPALASLIAERSPNNVDVFGSFFDRVLAEVGG
jgi:hypothetical protein